MTPCKCCLLILLAALCLADASTLQERSLPVFPAAGSAVLPDATAPVPRDKQNGSATTHIVAAPSAAAAAHPVDKLTGQPARKAAGLKSRAQQLAEMREENDWKNGLILWVFPDAWVEASPRMVRSWMRNYLMCMMLYCGTGAAWAYYIYYAFRRQCFGNGHIPAAGDMLEQIKVSFLSIPVYSMLPAIQEWVIEAGYTKAYPRVSDVGLTAHLVYFVAFMTCVEFGVYWAHRLLHDIRQGYKHLHYIHHVYNKENTLSPFAGLAFHPLDGIIQALPYCIMTFFIPSHFLTFEMLLFLTGVWTANIHDCLDGKVEPIMGAAYHTIHHTTYKHNYGHYFIYMDKLFGSLVTPDQYAESLAKPGSALKAA